MNMTIFAIVWRGKQMSNLIQLNLSKDDVGLYVGSDLVITNDDKTVYLQFGLDQFYNIINSFLELIGEPTAEQMADTILAQENKMQELTDTLEMYEEYANRRR